MTLRRLLRYLRIGSGFALLFVAGAVEDVARDVAKARRK